MSDTSILARVVFLSLGGVAGVNARYWLALAIDKGAGNKFPWATFAINVSGSFLIGLLATLLTRWGSHSLARILILTGFLGGYTTFSTFAYESLALFERGESSRAWMNMLGSVVLGLAAVWCGAMLGRAVAGPEVSALALSGEDVRPAVDD